jgi:hypothetical protein
MMTGRVKERIGVLLPAGEAAHRRLQLRLPEPAMGPNVAWRRVFSNLGMLLENRQDVSTPCVICARKDYLRVPGLPVVPALVAIAVNPVSGPGSFAVRHNVSRVSHFAFAGLENIPKSKYGMR